MRDDHAISTTAEQAITAALRAIQEALFTLGSEGDECIQKLVAVEALLNSENDTVTRRAVILAFHRGMHEASAETTLDSGHAGLRMAFDVGQRARRLNDRCRQDGRLNVGPFDTPRLREALANALGAAERS